MKHFLKSKLKSTLVYSNFLFFKKKIICFIPKKKYIMHEWKKVFDKELNLLEPKTFNEKIQWSKLYAKNDLAKICADKILVLDYVNEKIGFEYTNELIAIYPNINEIDFTKLPKQFVLKASHDSGSVLIVKDKSNINFNKLNEIKQNLKINYGSFSKEWVYDDIIPQILIEKYLDSEDGRSLKDYKVFCFNGEPKMIQVDLERHEGHKRNFYDTNWNRLDLAIGYPTADYDVSKPATLKKMLALSKILAQPFNHVRVDWYIHHGKLIFGEMTFFHGSGVEKFNNREWEEKIGNWFQISKDLSY